MARVGGWSCPSSEPAGRRERRCSSHVAPRAKSFCLVGFRCRGRGPACRGGRGGPAAHRCATELRRIGFDGAVTMVSAEPIPPYDRTLLSKGNLVGEHADVAALASPGVYEEVGVELRLGAEALALDPRARTVTLAGGSSIGYDRVVLAVGGGPVLPRALAAPGCSPCAPQPTSHRSGTRWNGAGTSS
ncbi:FAD-dependent oxidoreductase [Prauserella oleivorans]